jgi:hypothetical protein
MSDNIEPLILDLLEWLAREPRTYQELMEAWRTSCPRLTVWEDAVDRGLVERRNVQGNGTLVVVTRTGEDHLMARRRLSA